MYKIKYLLIGVQNSYYQVLIYYIIIIIIIITIIIFVFIINFSLARF